MGEHFPVREKSGDFAETGKVREFYPKYWTNQKKLYWKIKKKYWKSQGNLLASNSENPANMVPYFKKKKKTKIQYTGKLQKNTGKVREICLKKWEL